MNGPMTPSKWKKLESNKTFKGMPKATLDRAQHLLTGIAPTQRIAPPSQWLPRNWMSSIKIPGESTCKSSELSRKIPTNIATFLTQERVKTPWHFPKSKWPKSPTILWQPKISKPTSYLPRTVQASKKYYKNANSKQMRASTTLLT